MNNGEIGYCACKESCTENEGYCDFNYQCRDGHRCGKNNYCYVTIIGDKDFCNVEYPCGADIGDCDSDDECQNELFCGLNNCPNSLGVSSTIDYCESQGKLSLNCKNMFE